MDLALALYFFIGGAVILVWLYLWLRQRERLGHIPDMDQMLKDVPLTSNNDAVLVSREHGQLVYVNDRVRNWLGMNGGEPSLEYLAEMAQPADSFLELFAGEGQASFQLGQRWVEASSHRIPVGSELRTVVVMRELTSSTQDPDVLDFSLAMQVVNEIGETVNASLGVEQVLQTLLAIIRKAVPTDAGEICLWDEQEQALFPRGWIGDASYVLALAEAGGAYKLGEGVTGWIAQHRKPVLVTNLKSEATLQPKLKDSPYLSYVGVPLALEGRFMGTLELSSTKVGHFNQADMALLQAVSKPVAVAIHNAELYAEQSKRIEDMVGVQLIGQREASPEGISVIYYSLNERIATLADATMCGVLLYMEDKQALVAVPPFYGVPDHVIRNYTIPMPLESPQRDIWDSQSYWASDDVVNEPLVEALGLTPLVNVTGVYNTALIPLEIGKRRIGAIQVSNRRGEGGFTRRDIQNLRFLATQAATVVENIRLHERERHLDSELIGLQEMTQAISALSREETFYGEINERIAKLMQSAMCGVLLYDEESHRLVSQLPFYGLDDALVASYQIELTPGSALAQIWEEEAYWYTNAVSADPVVFEAGLEALAAATGVQKTLMAVLAVGEQRLGVVQVSNKLNGGDFTEEDARLLLIFATQAAAIIENARLYRAMQQRAEEAQRLRRVTELAGAIVTPDEPFTPVLAEIARLTDSQLVFIGGLDEQTGSLITYPRWVYGADLHEPIVQNIYAEGFQDTAISSQQPFMSNDLGEGDDTPAGYRPLVERLSLQRTVIVPLVIADRRLGMLGIANREQSPYDQNDVDVMQAVAAQITAALDRLRLNEAAGQNLSRRLQELDAVARVSNELSLTLELDRILDVIREEAARASGADGSTVALLRPQSEWQQGDRPELERRLGEKVKSLYLSDVELEAVRRGADSVMVQDYEQTSWTPSPEGAHSALAAAFLYANEVVGVIHLFHKNPGVFDERAAAFLMTLAAKASVGYGNALRYQEQIERSNRLRRRVEQLNQIFELGQMLHTNVDTMTMLEAIAYSVNQSIGFDVVVMLMLDDDGGALRRTAQAGMPLDVFEQSKGDVMSLEALRALLKDEYRTSESYFFPVEASGDWRQGNLAALNTEFAGMRTVEPEGSSVWREGDMLLVPMHGAGGEMLGIMALNRPHDNRRPDRNTIEMLEIFAHQAASTIENTRLYLGSLRSVEQQARLNEVMEAVASTLDIGEIFQAIARGALRLIPFMRMTAALTDTEQAGFDLTKITVAHDGSLTVSDERRLHLDNTALGNALQSGQDFLFYAGEKATDEFSDVRAWQREGERTTLIVPLIAGGTHLGAMHVGSDLQQAFGFEEFRPLLRRMAHLAAVAVQNARLFNQAINLRLFNESVVESIQQGIVVLDKSGRVLSFNAFMRQHYGWTDDAIRHDLFTYRPQLRAFLAEDVRIVLEQGIPQEEVGVRTSEAGKALVQNYYTYPLRTAESIRGAVLLVEDVTERVRLEQDIATRAQQLAALTEVSSRISASLDQAEVVRLALQEMGRIIGYNTITLWRRVGDEVVLEGARGVETGKLKAADKVVSINANDRLKRLVSKRRPYRVDRLRARKRLPGEAEMKSWLGVPLVNQENVTGVILLGKAEEGYYDTQMEQVAMAFANQVAVVLSNADLFGDAQRRAERLALLNRLSVALAQSLDSENILEVALREMAQTLNAEKAQALMIEPGTQTARVVVEYPRGDQPPSRTVLLNESAVFQTLVRTTKAVTYADTRKGATDDALLAEIAPRKAVSYMAVPLTVGGQVIGAFELESFDSPRHYDPEQINLAQIMANQAGIAVQNASLLEQTLVRTRELETLLEATQATSLTLDVDQVFRKIVELILHALDMDDCAIMIWDNVENVLEVEADINRYGDSNRITPKGTRHELSQYPARLHALTQREVVIINHDDPKADHKELEELHANGDAARMLVPLVVRDQAIGLIQVELQSARRELTYRETRLAQALGAQAAIAIENARLSHRTAAQVEELFIINELSQTISSTMDIDTMIKAVRNQVPRVAEAEGLYLALYDPDTQEISFPLFVEGGETRDEPPRLLGNDEVSFIIRYRRPLILGGDYFSPEEVRRNLGIVNGEGDAKSYLAVPLVAGDQVVGVLAIRDRIHTRAFGLNDQRILTTIGTQLGAAIQNARLFERIRNFADDLNRLVQERTVELSQERDRIDTLYRITAELARSLDLDRVLKRALEMVAHAVSADDGVVMVLDTASNMLYSRSALHGPAGIGRDGDTMPSHPAASLASWLMENHEHTLVIDDLGEKDYWDASAEGAEEWHSAISAALETGDDVLGVLTLFSREPAAFTEPHLKLVSAAANQIAVAVNNADLYHLIREQAERLGALLRAEQEEAEKNSAILEGIADGVLLTDASGKIIQMNGSAERIIELPRSKVLGQPLPRLGGLYGDTSALWVKRISDWALDPQHHRAGEFLAERLDLGRRVVSVQLSPVHSGGQFIGTVAVFRDITREVESDRIKSDFISNVSHELRTPMTSIKGYADLLLIGTAGEVNELQERFLKTIKVNADRLSVLVNDLLNISRLDAGGDQLKVELVDLAQVFNLVVSNVQNRTEHESKELQVSIEVESGLPPVQADLHKVTRILSNLVDNAFNYTYPGGSIEIKANLNPSKQDHVLITVKDTGIGIPEEFQTRVWERFERYEEHALVMDVPGVGLGLPIVRDLVKMHRGDVWFDSTEGQGSTFYVSLPIRQPEYMMDVSNGGQEAVEG